VYQEVQHALEGGLGLFREIGKDRFDLMAWVQLQQVPAGTREFHDLRLAARLLLGLGEKALLHQRPHGPADRAIGHALEAGKFARGAEIPAGAGKIAKGRPLGGEHAVLIAPRMQDAGQQLEHVGDRRRRRSGHASSSGSVVRL
jgi:hypothetical protein